MIPHWRLEDGSIGAVSMSLPYRWINRTLKETVVSLSAKALTKKSAFLDSTTRGTSMFTLLSGTEPWSPVKPFAVLYRTRLSNTFTFTCFIFPWAKATLRGKNKQLYPPSEISYIFLYYPIPGPGCQSPCQPTGLCSLGWQVCTLDGLVDEASYGRPCSRPFPRSPSTAPRPCLWRLDALTDTWWTAWSYSPCFGSQWI